MDLKSQRQTLLEGIFKPPQSCVELTLHAIQPEPAVQTSEKGLISSCQLFGSGTQSLDREGQGGQYFTLKVGLSSGLAWRLI